MGSTSLCGVWRKGQAWILSLSLGIFFHVRTMQLGEQKTKNKKQILEFCFLFFVKSKQLGRKKPKKWAFWGKTFCVPCGSTQLTHCFCRLGGPCKKYYFSRSVKLRFRIAALRRVHMSYDRRRNVGCKHEPWCQGKLNILIFQNNSFRLTWLTISLERPTIN